MRKLTILAAPYGAVGPVNATSGALSGLVARGHRVIFVIEQSFCGKLAALGYEEHIVQVKKPDDCEKPGEVIAKSLLDSKVLGPFTPWEKLERFLEFCSSAANYDEIEAFEHGLKQAIKLYKPDLIYADCGVLWPSVQYSGIPWIRNVSVTPTFYIVDDEADFPPSSSGLSSDSDRQTWKEFNQLRRKVFISKQYNDFLQKLSYDRYAGDVICPQTQLMSVYAYPEELNYEGIRQKGWFNLEVFNKCKSDEGASLEQIVPKQFWDCDLDGQFSGKWVYLSMGSMGAVDLVLMKRFMDVLAKTNHKYIVSKGPRHSEYELPPNMWGDRYLPQTKILPLVDLVITHGGNNTVTESFAQGRPMIVLPLFSDQYDNAQRVHETGYGIRLEPYNFTEYEMIEAIKKLLNDTELHKKLKTASRRIQLENRCELLADKIEQLVESKIQS